MEPPPPPPETVRAACAGDRHAFDTVFEQTLPGLVAFIRSKLGRRLAALESATDLAQSVCREVLVDIDKFEFRGEAAFRGWVYKQATRKIIDKGRYYSRERRDVAMEVSRDSGDNRDDLPSLVACYASLATPSRHASAREELERFESALDELPEAQRDAVMMSRLLGLEYNDIAETLEISPAAVRGLVARGLANIADQLS